MRPSSASDVAMVCKKRFTHRHKLVQPDFRGIGVGSPSLPEAAIFLVNDLYVSACFGVKKKHTHNDFICLLKKEFYQTEIENMKFDHLKFNRDKRAV